MKDNFNQLRIIHFGLMAGCFLYALMMFIFILDWSEMKFIESAFLYVLLALAIILLPLERFLYRKGKSKINSEMTDDEKLQIYKSTKIISWAILEGISLVGIVYLIIESNWYFIILAFCSFLLLCFRFPNPSEMKNDFQLENDLD